MISLTICLILLTMVLFGVMSQGAGDLNDQWSRVSWIGICCGLVVAVQAPNPFASILIAGVSLGLIWRQPMSVTYREKLAQGLALAGAYVVAAPRMEGWMVVPLLTMMGVVGSLTGLWAIYSSLQAKDVGYRHEYLAQWIILCDRDGGAPLAGQGNFNHAQSVGALSAAASVGLLLFDDWWGIPLLLLSMVAVILCTEYRMTGQWKSQGLLHLCWLGLVTLAIFLPVWIGWGILLAAIAAMLCYAHPWNPRPNWIDSGRFSLWTMALRDIWWRANQPRHATHALEMARADRVKMEALQAQAASEGNALLHNQMTVAKAQNEEEQRRCVVLAKQQQDLPLVDPVERAYGRRLWAQRLRVRVMGHGTGAWYPLTKWPAMFSTGTMNEQTKQFSGMVYLSAHNEYVELLFEQGMLGLGAGLGLAGHALYWTWGTPVFPLVMVLLSVCATNFPFTLFAEVEKGSPAQPEQFVGSPAMLVMAWVTLLLVEAVRG